MDTNLLQLLQYMSQQKAEANVTSSQWFSIFRELVVPVGTLLAALGIWIKARAAEINSKKAAEIAEVAVKVAVESKQEATDASDKNQKAVDKIHEVVNSKADAMIAKNDAALLKVEEMHGQLAHLKAENAALREQMRGKSSPSPTLIGAGGPLPVKVEEVSKEMLDAIKAAVAAAMSAPPPDKAA